MTSLRRFTRSQESLAHKSFFLKRKPVPLDGKVLRSNPPCHIRFRTIFTGVLRTWRSDENDGWKVGVEASPRFTWKGTVIRKMKGWPFGRKKKNHVFIESQKGKKKNYSWQDSSTRTFFITAADYMVSKFPCSSDVVMYTCFSTQLWPIYRNTRLQHSSCLKYFINRFPCLLLKHVSLDAVPDVSGHKPRSWCPSQEGWRGMDRAVSLGKQPFFWLLWCFDGDDGYYYNHNFFSSVMWTVQVLRFVSF